MYGVLPADNVPVLYEADAVVVGGSLSGIACAVRLARHRLKTVVIEPRTYLGRELTAALRPWIDLQDTERDSLPELIRYCLEHSGAAGGERVISGSVPLHPDRLKISLENLLADHGVDLIYASLPIGFVGQAGSIDGLVIANKSGRQAILCRYVIDATETAGCARLCGEDVSRYSLGNSALYFRTLEFTGVDAQELNGDRLNVPEHIGVLGNTVRFREGIQGSGHLYAEYSLELESDNRMEANRNREIRARHIGFRLAAHLIQNVPAFRKAFLAASSCELHGPFPRGEGTDPFALGRPSGGRRRGLADGSTLKSGVYSLGKSVYRDGCTDLLDPVQACVIGEQAAQELLALRDRSRAISPKASSDSSFRSSTDRLRVEACADRGREFGAVELHVPSSAGVDRGRQTVPVEEAAVPVLRRADVLVVGGGTSGACAAITAAGEGMNTVLVDLNPGLGGTGTFGGVDSYWFGRKVGFAAKITAGVQSVQQELRYKGHKWNVEAKMYALLRDAERAGVELLLNAVTCGAIKSGNRVCGAVVATRWGLCAVLASVVIDASGDGDVAAFAGAEFVYGSEKDHAVMWYSLAQFKEPGKTQNNFTSMVDVSDALDYTRAILAGRRRGEACHDHGIYIATRESRHIKGDVTMRLTDQLLQRRWPDVVNIHFSNHDVKGVSGADWVNVGLIPPNLEIEIPFRMLLPQGLEGLLVAGKAVSATHDALPAIRMQADLENLGAVAALAAAMAVKGKQRLREIDIRSLQDRLVKEGLLPEKVLKRTLSPILYREDDLVRLAESIETKPLYEYANMRMNETYTRLIPFIEICSAGPRMVPILEKAMERAEGVKKIRLAQALALMGSRTGVPVLIEAILKELEGPELPVRTAEIMYVQLPPDHGAMPDTAYLLYSLAAARDPRSVAVWQRVVDLLDFQEEDLKDSRKGLFYYIDAVCRGAERLGDPSAVPVLETMHRHPLLRGQQCTAEVQADYFLERRAMLELAIGRALARCGSPEGYRILIDYLPDNRALLARSAWLELRRLSGRSFAADPEVWDRWVREEKPYRQPQPLMLSLDVEPDSESILRLERFA
jgi:flavin-dependent dehydrogenase